MPSFFALSLQSLFILPFNDLAHHGQLKNRQGLYGCKDASVNSQNLSLPFNRSTVKHPASVPVQITIPLSSLCIAPGKTLTLECQQHLVHALLMLLPHGRRKEAEILDGIQGEAKAVTGPVGR